VQGPAEVVKKIENSLQKKLFLHFGTGSGTIYLSTANIQLLGFFIFNFPALKTEYS